jgi:hypothetical protein
MNTLVSTFHYSEKVFLSLFKWCLMFDSQGLLMYSQFKTCCHHLLLIFKIMSFVKFPILFADLNVESQISSSVLNQPLWSFIQKSFEVPQLTVLVKFNESLDSIVLISTIRRSAYFKRDGTQSKEFAKAARTHSTKSHPEQNEKINLSYALFINYYPAKFALLHVRIGTDKIQINYLNGVIPN